MEKWLLEVVGQRVRQNRKLRNFSQEELGERAGFHFSYIGGVERAEKNITLTNLQIIADALEVPVHELVMTERDYKRYSIKNSDELLRNVQILINKLKTSELKKVHLFITEILEQK
ncbi:helix-turn-helix domain-containing protein [Paenibacillus sp. LPE1-1-1.1]|uniref:helix-turn-helix domain-containing protein n=1 Tax=Paenibacillus sp. LPE1-1-1.1 TaxID=3135230 RepID=UPI00342FDC2C